jgi:hypothetical protein
MDYLYQKEGSTARMEFFAKAAVGITAASATGAMPASRASAVSLPQASELIKIVPGVIGPQNGKYAKYVRPSAECLARGSSTVVA